METRSQAQARAREVQSSESPASYLESPLPRPSGRASELEGDLGLTSLLGDGEASVVGRGDSRLSAVSGPCDVTVVAEQGQDVPVTVIDSVPTRIVTSTTSLPGPRAQVSTSGLEQVAVKSSYQRRPVQVPSLHQGGEAQIRTRDKMSVTINH